MPTTPIYALPYPAAADPADVPLDLQELADRIEAVLVAQAGMTKIVDLSAAAGAAIDFLSIPATFAHLRLVGVLRGAGAGASGVGFAQFNNDTGNNYGYEKLSAVGTAVTGAVVGATNLALLGDVPAAATAAGIFAALTVDLPDYRSANRKTLIAHTGGFYAGGIAQMIVSEWAGGVINKISVSAPSGLAVGSRLTLYGLA